MLGLVVAGSRTWMCTIAAPALAASIADCAIWAGVTGTAGFLPGVSAEPVTAQEIMILRCMSAPIQLKNKVRPRGDLAALGPRRHAAGQTSPRSYEIATWAGGWASPAFTGPHPGFEPKAGAPEQVAAG